MKIKIEMDEQAEEEVIIRCRGMTEQIAAIQRAVSEAAGAVQKIVLYKGNTEYYLPMNDILFFETADHGVAAHTGNDMYEEILPGFFMRVSKSTILNTSHIFSINRNLTASSVVAFENTHKKVYVSRYYYKPLISKLEERRLHQ